MISDLEYFFMSTGHLYVIFGEGSTRSFSRFLKIGSFVLLVLSYLRTLLVEMQIDATKQKTAWSFLKDSEVQLLGLYLKKPKTLIQKNLCMPIFFAVLFIIAKIWKQLKCPSVGERIKKLWHIYTMGKTEILPLVTAWMDMEIIMLSEMSQSQKDKYHMSSVTCGI